MPARTPEEIQALIAAAFNSGDLDAFVDLHEETATVRPPGGERAGGHEAIRASAAPIFALRPTLRNEVLGSLRGDGLAIVHARWELRGSEAGRDVEMAGVATIVSRRQPDGTWRIVLEDTVRAG